MKIHRSIALMVALLLVAGLAACVRSYREAPVRLPRPLKEAQRCLKLAQRMFWNRSICLPPRLRWLPRG